MTDDLRWQTETRRQSLRHQQRLNGIDYIRLGEDRRTVTVVFFRRPPEDIDVGNFSLTGPVRRGPRVIQVRLIEPADRDLEGDVELILDHAGDLSTYHLTLTGLPDIDPRYASAEFRFNEDLDARIDCAPDAPPAPVLPDSPELDYLAKDYAGFRQLALDRLSQTVPGWTERHVPDLGIALIELMAYVGDHLSYYQDAVATEAYLATARLRTSIRRHTRLIDYDMHEGCNARVWLHIALPPWRPSARIPARDISFTVGDEDATAVGFASGGFGPIQFAPVHDSDLLLFEAHNEIAFYDWGNTTCWLPAGATSATLRDAWVDETHATGPGVRRLADLAVGQVLLIENLRDSDGSEPGDPALRHYVRLTHVAHEVDPLFDHPVVEVQWAVADALPFLLPLTAPPPAGSHAHGHVCSVARGNIVLADHGRLVQEIIPGRDHRTHHLPAFAPLPRRPLLGHPDLTFCAPPPDPYGPAADALSQDPREATPRILSLTSRSATQQPGQPRTLHWVVRPDLIESGPQDCHVVVEMDNDGIATLRFGDGVLGHQPGEGELHVSYRVGSGSAGQVGAETITGIGLAARHDPSGLVVRNPLPSSGFALPETCEDVKLLAPAAFRRSMQRAITADDYATIAASQPGVRRAAADLIKLGARRVAQVAIAPSGSGSPSAALLARVEAALRQVRRIGHDVHVRPAAYAPLDIELRVSVKADYLRGDVLSALLKVFGAGIAADETRGMFHPDNLDFGGALHASRLIAAAQGVVGVDWVQVTRMQRLVDLPDPADLSQPLENAALYFDGFEIPQLENDPRHPARGRLSIILVGGR